MKKVLLLVVTLTIALLAHAQASVQVGFLLNNLKAENAEVGKVAGAYKGMMAVADYNIHLTEFLGIAPGLGIDYSFNNQVGYRYKELGLLAPVDVNYCLSVNDNLSLSLFAGPTFYYGLFAKETSVNPPYDYYKNDSKRFDVALGGGFWLDIMENIRVKLGYKFGLTNTSRTAGTVYRNNIMSITVGYVF